MKPPAPAFTPGEMKKATAVLAVILGAGMSIPFFNRHREPGIGRLSKRRRPICGGAYQIHAVRVLASMSPDDTAAALRLLKVLEECGQMTLIEAGEWRRRITGWARFREMHAETAPNA